MTLSEMLVLIKTLARESIGDKQMYFDEEICAILAISQKEFARSTNILQKRISQSILAGEQAFIYPENVLNVYSVTVRSTGLLLRKVSRAFLDINYPGWLNSAPASPDIWAVLDWNIYLRAPTSSADTLDLVVSFLPEIPFSLADLSSSPELPEQFHMALVWHALYIITGLPIYSDRYMVLVGNAQVHEKNSSLSREGGGKLTHYF